VYTLWPSESCLTASWNCSLCSFSWLSIWSPKMWKACMLGMAHCKAIHFVNSIANNGVFWILLLHSGMLVATNWCETGGFYVMTLFSDGQLGSSESQWNHPVDTSPIVILGVLKQSRKPCQLVYGCSLNCGQWSSESQQSTKQSTSQEASLTVLLGWS